MNAAGKNNRETTGGYGNLPRAEKKNASIYSTCSQIEGKEERMVLCRQGKKD